MEGFRARLEARKAAAAAASAASAAVTAVASAAKRAVKFIGNATGASNVLNSPTRKASPHHRNRAATRKSIRASTRVSPNAAPAQAPGTLAPKFKKMVRTKTHNEYRTTHSKTAKNFARSYAGPKSKGRANTRRHMRSVASRPHTGR